MLRYGLVIDFVKFDCSHHQAQRLTCYSGNDVAESNPALLHALDERERFGDLGLQDDLVRRNFSRGSFQVARDGHVLGVGALVVVVPKTPVLKYHEMTNRCSYGPLGNLLPNLSNTRSEFTHGKP